MRNILIALGVTAAAAVVGVAAYEKFGKPAPMPAAGPSSSAPSSTADGAAAQSPRPSSTQDRATFEIRPADKVLGDPNAKVTIVEYASLTCPHCASFHADTLPGLKSEYIDKGTVKLVFRDYPLDGLALRAAMLPHCAGDERYFGMLDLLFARQSTWAVPNDPLGALANVVRQAGMSDSEFQACLSNKEVEQTVLASALEGERTYQVRSTPTLFVNGVRYAGALSLDQLRAIVDPLVAAK